MNFIDTKPTFLPLPQTGGDASVHRPFQARTQTQQDFAGIIARQSSSDAAPAEVARDAAEQFVAVALIQPVLAKIRSSQMGAAPFTAGKAELQMHAMHDAVIARQISRAANFPIVDSIESALVNAHDRRNSNALAHPEKEAIQS